MELAATKKSFDSPADVIKAGEVILQDPIVYVSLSDSTEGGEYWSLLVDIVDYAKAEADAYGYEDFEYCKEAYVDALQEIDSDIDDFEAELFWHAYVEATGKYVEELDDEDDD